MRLCDATTNGWGACAARLLSTPPGLMLGLGLLLALVLWALHRHRRRQLAARPAAAPDDQVRRRAVLSLALASCALDAAHGQNGAAKPQDTLAKRTPPGVLTRVRLHNTSNDLQAAGFVSPMFGQPFQQGDMPKGMYPRFTLEDGTPCPATLWGITSWPDGSMKFCAAMLQVGAPIARRDVLDIHVRSGGDKPPASRRTTAELHAAALQVELTGVSGLEGTWLATLSDGIREASDLVLLGDGAAGAVWRIGSEFRDPQGRPHGQLYCWHYVAALNGADGRLLGLRYLGRVAQPWADVTTPAARHRDLTARLLAAGRTVRALQGHLDSETPGSTIRLPHFASFFTAGDDARWDEVQADGVSAAATSMRVSMDVPYVQLSRLMPPYDRQAHVRPANEISYRAMGRGSVERGMGNTGERPDIGVIPDWNVRHLLSQTAFDEQITRVNGLVAGGWRLATRKRSTRQPVPCVDNRPSYTKLGNTEASWRGPGYAHGVVLPSPNTSLWGEDVAHRPGCAYWPYVFSGEPQYLDLMIEHACTHLLALAPGSVTFATEHPISKVFVDGWHGDRDSRIGAGGTLYKGAGILFMGSGGLRTPAWASRDVVQAAALCPDTPPDGAAVRDYLRDVMHSAYSALADYAKKMPASFSQAGLFIMNEGNESPWMRSYLSWSVCHQADILATPQAEFAREYFSRLWRAFAAIADIDGLTAYRCNFWDGKQMGRRIEDAVCLRQETLVFEATSSRGTVVGNEKARTAPWNPQNGDVFAFGSPEASPLLPFPQAQPNQRLYAVNCSGTTFQLALAAGGAPVPIPKDLTIPSYMCRAKDLALASARSSTPYHYPANLRGAVAYHLQRGDRVQAAKTALDAIVARQNPRFDDRPKYFVT